MSCTHTRTVSATVEAPPAEYDSDDSMVSNTDRDGFLKRHAKATRNRLSDAKHTVKDKFGKTTHGLCSACREIPFEECLPDSITENGNPQAQSESRKSRHALVFFKSLSKVLDYRSWCKMCRLLYRSICEPEYDLFKAEHIQKYLQDSDKLKNLRSFTEWMERFPYWKREWVGGADIWPFGYAVNRQQAASSTLQQAKELFAQAEDRDVNTTSLNDIENMYKTGEMADQAMLAAHEGMSLLGLVGGQKSQEAQKLLAGGQFVTSHMALLNSKKRKRLPCIFVIRAYRKHENKAGALSVRVYGHGRAPLAPLKEICHFSLRFEGSGDPRIVKEQIWYGRKLQPYVDVPFFRHCIQACRSRHVECETLQWNMAEKKPKLKAARESHEVASFRLIDVEDMRLIKTDFESLTKQTEINYVALSYTWGTTPLPEGWVQQTTPTPEGGSPEPYYWNTQTQETTWTRPVPTSLTTANEATLMNKIDFDSADIWIPQTIRDSIEVVKRVGQRYLWVDQLCIIQQHSTDDEAAAHDIRANLARMDRIYSHALFTIVAGDSPHADFGIDGIRRARYHREQLIEDGIVNNARLCLPVSMELNFDPWEKRAWCFQEKLLSRRLLVFAGGFAVWHCRGGVWREDVNALDGDKSSVSFPWLRLTAFSPPDTPEFGRAPLKIREMDESVRLMRPPALDQYISAVEDFTNRTIGKGWQTLDAFQGLQNILSCPKFLDSPFRNGLPSDFLDIALLWQPQEALRRRKDHVDDQGNVLHRCPPSWTWAGWESARQIDGPGSQSGAIYYEEPFDVQADDLGMVKRLNKLGEERIRPRKGTLYGVGAKGQTMMDLGLFSLPKMGAKGFTNWDSWQPRPATWPRLKIPINTLDDRHLVLQTEVASLQLGNEIVRKRTYSKLAGFEYCRETVHSLEHVDAVTGTEGPTDSDVKITTSHEYTVNTRLDTNVGVVKLDTGLPSKSIIEALILSEAQYLGNEINIDVLGYPLYNVMLIERERQNVGDPVAERIGLGKVYKYAWKKAEPKRTTIILK